MRHAIPTLRRLLLPALLLSSLTLTSCFCKKDDPQPKKANYEKHNKKGSRCGNDGTKPGGAN